MKKIFFDTNAIRALSFEDIKMLLGACKDGFLSVSVCEPVIVERANQYYQEKFEGIFVPVRLVDIIGFFFMLFENNNVQVIKTNPEYLDKAKNLVANEDTYFNDSVENDFMDALIFSIAEETVDKGDAVIVCIEKNLKREFESNGYEVRSDPKVLLSELLADSDNDTCHVPEIPRISEVNPHLLEGLKKGDKQALQRLEEELNQLPEEVDRLDDMLREMQNIDEGLIKRVIGYAQWFAPISKDDLNNLLNDRYEEDLVANVTDRLCIDGVLVETGRHVIPNVHDENNKLVCDQAMSAVMAEIVEIMELT